MGSSGNSNNQNVLARIMHGLKRAVQLFGAGIVFWLIKQYFRQRKVVRDFIAKNPKAPTKFLERGMLGSIPLVLKNYKRLYDWKNEQFRELGNVESIPLVTAFWDPRIIIMNRDPKNVQHILKTRFENYVKGEKFLAMLEPLLGRGIFGVNHGVHAKDGGKDWYFQRKTASKIFTRNVYTGIMYEAFSQNSQKIVKMIQDTKEGEPIEMQDLFFKFTMDSIGIIGFGVDLKTLDAKDPSGISFMKAFDDAQKLSAKRFLLPLIEALGPLSKYVYKDEKRLFEAIETLDAFTYQVINERLEDKTLEEKNDILSHFVKAFKKEGEGFGPTQLAFLRDIVMSFFIAGRDTTAAALSFTLYMLCLHPECQEKIYLELKEELKDDQSPPDWTQLRDKFPYLNGAVYEVLRLYGSVPTDGKASVEEDVLPDGTVVAPGTVVNYEVYCMGRSENIWGQDAAEFKPERWIGPGKVEPTEWQMPTFQGGIGSPRSCLGRQTAIYETKILIAQLVRKYQFTLARPKVNPDYVPGLTLTVNEGLPVIAKART